MTSGRISRRVVVERLEEQGIGYELLALQNDSTLAAVRRGGRLFLFLPDGEGVFWLHQAFNDPNAFAKLVGRGEWNIGGERIWISPEIQFNIRDRSDVWASYHLPKQMDPGQWTLERIAEDTCRLSQELSLEAYNTASGQKSLTVERFIRPAEDPLRNLTVYQDLTRGVVFAGYEHAVTITEVETGRDLVPGLGFNPIETPWDGAGSRLAPNGANRIPGAKWLERGEQTRPRAGSHHG